MVTNSVGGGVAFTTLVVFLVSVVAPFTYPSGGIAGGAGSVFGGGTGTSLNLSFLNKPKPAIGTEETFLSFMTAVSPGASGPTLGVSGVCGISSEDGGTLLLNGLNFAIKFVPSPSFGGAWRD